MNRVFATAENLVATLASVACTRNHNVAPKQSGLHQAKIGKITNARDFARKNVDRLWTLQRHVMQIVVHQNGAILCRRNACQLLHACTRAMHDQP